MKQQHATIWHRPDCNRVYVRAAAEDGLSKQEWCFGFLSDGTIYLRALLTMTRRTRRYKWRWVPERCWFTTATEQEALEYLPDATVPLPTDQLGPLVAHIVVRRGTGR